MYTSDARFVLSASDDGNVRLWKADSHERLGVMDTRERNAIEYREALKQRWKFDAEVGKVLRCVPLKSLSDIALPLPLETDKSLQLKVTTGS